MSDSERSPLLSATVRSSTGTADSSLETTPLLSSPDVRPLYNGEIDGNNYRDANGDVASISPSFESNAPSNAAETPKNRGHRWPSIISIVILALLAVSIIVVAFFVPTAVEKYAKEAAVLEPTSLSLESITADGVRARVQANFRLDGSRVKDDNVRRVGRLATWVVRQLGTEETKVDVYLPEYDGALLGTAAVPPLVLNIMDGHGTAVDFVTELTPGDAESVRSIANEWLRGSLDMVRLRGTASIQLKSGLIPLGTHTVSEILVLEAKNIPQVPHYNITRLNFGEVVLPRPHSTRAIVADISVSVLNRFPLRVDIPELRFDILVPNCDPSDPYIPVADATTRPVAVWPLSEVVVEGRGTIEDLPESLTSACPDSSSSPLDLLLKQFLSGDGPTVFVRGARDPLPGTPDWISEILSSVTAPVPFPASGGFDDLVRDFSLTDVHFTLPDPLAEPGDPDADPKVSGTILVSAALPSEMNFEVNVTDVKADADVFYRSQKLGELNLREWQPANSTRVPSDAQDREARLKIQSRIMDAPLNVTDGDVLTDVIQALLFGSKPIRLDIKAAVAVRIDTVLGTFVLKDVPAQGKIPVKPLPKGTLGSLAPKISGIQITDTTYSSVSLQALVNFTNPTPYSASIPWINVHVLSNGSLVGEATAENLSISSGKNIGVLVSARWNPSMGGDLGESTGRDLISQYLSGYNTTVTLRAHRGSIPCRPLLGEALSKVDINISAPHLEFPGRDDDERRRFIRDATFHLFSSTATFTLLSPLERNILYVENVNATAFYNHTEPVGTIEYSLPFAATPGESQTPRLPVEWSLGSDGYEKLRRALGGRLKLDARAIVGVRLGNWRETVWYVGRGIGANIRI